MRTAVFLGQKYPTLPVFQNSNRFKPVHKTKILIFGVTTRFDNMMNHDKKHIEALKNAVREKFGRTIESASDFDALSLDISLKTGDNISASTLKRVFGYVKYDAAPSLTTLSILARYAGYEGWSDFRMPKQDRRGNRRNIIAISLFGILSVIGLVLIINSFSGQNATTHEVMETNGSSSDITGTAEDKYMEILTGYITAIKQKMDPVMALRDGMPLYRYIEKCDSAYFEIFYDIKKTIPETIAAAFPGNDTLQAVYSSKLFNECRDFAVELQRQFTHEERIQAGKEQYEVLTGRKYGE